MPAAKSYYLTCILICLSLYASGQWRGLRTTRLGPAEGLNTKVNKVVQDSTGMIYMASSQGLIRYDGSHFEICTHLPGDSTSIGVGEIYNVIAGSDGKIWCASRYSGLSVFNPQTGSFRQYPLPELPFHMVPTAHGLLEDADGHIWVGGHHFQLLRFDRQEEQFTAYQPDWINPEAYGKRLSISSILQDRQIADLLWISVVDFVHPESESSGFGLCAFQKSTGRFTAYRNGGRIKYQDAERRLYGTNIKNTVTRFSPLTESYEMCIFPPENRGFVSSSISPSGGSHTPTMIMFSNGQKDRMRATLDGSRSSLQNANNCCLSSLTITGVIHGSGDSNDYRAGNDIESSNTLLSTDSKTVFQASHYVDLNIGFTAGEGSFFLAAPAPCDTLFVHTIEMQE